MDFTFTEDQIAFRDAVHSMFMREVSPELIRELWDGETGRSDALWAELVNQGLLAVSVPEAQGGLGLSDIDWVLMTEEVGYYGLPEPLLDNAYIGVAGLNALPDGLAARDETLAAIAEGTLRLAVDNGRDPHVADAHVADKILSCRDGKVVLFDKADVTLQAVESIDPSRRMFVMTPNGAGQVLAEGVDAERVAAAMFNRGALAAAGQMLGLTRRMVDIAVDYTVQRKQFNRAIGSFQAVKHLMANVMVKLEFAKPVVYRAAHSLAAGVAEQDVDVSSAKVAATEAALLAARNGIQAHGAMGYTWELDLQIFAKRAWSLDNLWGSRGCHKNRVGDFLFSADAAIGPSSLFTRED